MRYSKGRIENLFSMNSFLFLLEENHSQAFFFCATIKIGDAKIAYGSFIQSIIDFLLIALCIFVVIRLFEKLKLKEAKEKKVEIPPKKSDEVLLLEEIRDLLKEEQTLKK